MKALVLKRYGGPNHVVFADIPRPVPKADEILVEVRAAGLNPIDNTIPKQCGLQYLPRERGGDHG